MDKPNILSGEQIVIKGITKIDASLPEIGLKDTIPNGSWLEQKQIQAALEARKHLIDVERIEKCGNLSHAEWQDNLKLALVTQKAGSYWQYFGHNVGKNLYLNPEEALFLMEVNCLLLKHNDVTVSIQKAYSLIQYSSISIIQYKVYASLSRLGYKVFRHNGSYIQKNISTLKKEINEHDDVLNVKDVEISNHIEDANNIETSNCENQNTLSESTVTDDVISNDTTSTIKTEDVNADENKTASELCNSEAILKVEVENTISVNEKTIEIQNRCSNTHFIKLVDSEITPENEKGLELSNLEQEKTINETVAAMEVEFSDNGTKDQIKNELNDDSASSTNEIGSDDKSDLLYKPTDNLNKESSNSDLKGSQNDENKMNCGELDTENQQVDHLNQSLEEDKAAINENIEITLNMEITDESSNINTASGSGINPKEKSSLDQDNSVEGDMHSSKQINTAAPSSTDSSHVKNQQPCYVTKLHKLCNRQLKPTNAKALYKHFESIPDLYQREVFTVNVPDEVHIPKNIFVNKCSYTLNLQDIRMKNIRPVSNESDSYSITDEVNASHVRRIRNTTSTDPPHYPNQYHSTSQFPNPRFLRPNLNFRPYSFCRAPNNLNYYQFRMFLPRLYFQDAYFMPRFNFNFRPHPFLRNFPNPNERKRSRGSLKASQLQGIKTLAGRLKQLIMSGNSDAQNVQSLQRLLLTYNMKYKTRLRLTENFDIINDETIVETIELDDDDESRSKRPRLDERESNMFKENLNTLRQLALKLNDLEVRNKATARHRRVFSNAIRTFNKSYNADIYLNSNYEVIDRKHISLDSSSESDCVVEEPQKGRKGKKMLRNPFNILKKHFDNSESSNIPTTSNERIESKIEVEDKTNYTEEIQKAFDKWLPSNDDFGRAEVVSKSPEALSDGCKEEYLFDFMKEEPHKYNNWLEVKMSYLRYIQEANIAFQNQQTQLQNEVDEVSESSLKPLVSTEDCTDMPSVLEKLRIIKHNKEIKSDFSLRIDFDVYNRDIQNFKKTNPPNPHFRVICTHDSTIFPSASEVLSLYSAHEDHVPIVFAAVGIGSISYLQINPVDLPIYVPGNDFM